MRYSHRKRLPFNTVYDSRIREHIFRIYLNFLYRINNQVPAIRLFCKIRSANLRFCKFWQTLGIRIKESQTVYAICRTAKLFELPRGGRRNFGLLPRNIIYIQIYMRRYYLSPDLYKLCVVGLYNI